ncbi:MAG: HAMP domain-containing sensor histidine kinase [Bacteroidetes bacterium]|nr:HAMP domain-containing sensor histidine kinase [Bacteroidota bacterium]
MKPLLKNKFIRHYGWLILAVLFFASSFIFSRLYSGKSSINREVRLAEQYINERLEDFYTQIKDTARLNRLMANTEELPEFERMIKKDFSLYLFAKDGYNDPQLKFWSDHQAVPPTGYTDSADGEYFKRLANGWYVIAKHSLPVTDTLQRQVAMALIPVRSEFFLTTEYLPSRFFFSSDADKQVRLTENPGAFPVKTKNNTVLFYLDKKPAAGVPYNDRQTIFLRFAGLLLLFLFLQLFAERMVRTKGVWTASAFLALVLILLRLLTYFYPQILNLRQFELFDPSIYGSNAIQRSLGDLLINSVLFCWWVLFTWTLLKGKEKPIAYFSPGVRIVAGVIAAGLLIFCTFILAAVIRSLVADSKISFDVTDFFSLTRYTVVGFFVLSCLSLAYYYFSQLLFRIIFNAYEGKEIVIYFAICALGLLFLTLRPGNPDVLFYLPVLCWLLAYTWLVNRGGVYFTWLRINIAGILSWIFIFSVSISFIMLSQIRKVEWEKRKAMAEKFTFQSDPSSETRMSIAVKYLDNDFLNMVFPRFQDEVQNRRLKDSIISAFYSASLNKYDTRLYVYDSLNRPLYNDDGLTCDGLNIIITEQSKQTETPGIYYYETSYEKFSYIVRMEVTDSVQRKVGTFFVVSNLKTYAQDALFPELFKKNKKDNPENSQVYSHAVYVNNRLVSPPGNYAFRTSLRNDEIPRAEAERRDNDNFDELWYKTSNEKIIVVARKKETTIETITLFSYIFCSFLFLVIFVQTVSFFLKTGFSIKKFRNLIQLNIRSQVHGTIIFISLFSFLIIGAATISFFIERNKFSNSDKLSRTMKIMVNEMEKKLEDHSVSDDVVKLYDSVTNSELQNLVKDVSDIHGVDVNVYDLEGDLKVSSEANVYTQGVLSRKMDPGAFYHLSRLRQVLHVQDEKIGDFSYFSIYSPVRTDSGQVYAYVNIPYFSSKPELRQEISNFLVTIINLNAFIFLIAGLIALFVTNRITHSFSIISEKMQEVNLGKMNEQIVWNRNDEIGVLVKEYNKMVTKLEESAAALAKSEREGAWREMARQVAHEIKNPLTPMKLHIQYLQKAISNNQPNVKELSASVANTLVEQIDHLSKIAADFSQFANIGNTSVSRFDLHDVIASLKDLYTADSQILVEWRPIADSLNIEADKTQMNRLFTNLLANAVEACNGNAVCRIEVSEMRNGDTIRISIKDNGEGIAPETQERIFVPNFTTKSSGTGLGLAMCKGIVEKARGRIWFETEQGKGTTFFVELPLEVQATQMI